MQYNKVNIRSREDLPRDDGLYFVNRSGFMSVMEFETGRTEMMWMKDIIWYIDYCQGFFPMTVYKTNTNEKS